MSGELITLILLFGLFAFSTGMVLGSHAERRMLKAISTYDGQRFEYRNKFYIVLKAADYADIRTKAGAYDRAKETGELPEVILAYRGKRE